MNVTDKDIHDAWNSVYVALLKSLSQLEPEVLEHLTEHYDGANEMVRDVAAEILKEDYGQ